jgi:hypothetical protein
MYVLQGYGNASSFGGAVDDLRADLIANYGFIIGNESSLPSIIALVTGYLLSNACVPIGTIGSDYYFLLGYLSIPSAADVSNNATKLRQVLLKYTSKAQEVWSVLHVAGADTQVVPVETPKVTSTYTPFKKDVDFAYKSGGQVGLNMSVRAVFTALQTAINTVARSFDAPRIVVDGVLGNGTVSTLRSLVDKIETKRGAVWVVGDKVKADSRVQEPVAENAKLLLADLNAMIKAWDLKVEQYVAPRMTTPSAEPEVSADLINDMLKNAKPAPTWIWWLLGGLAVVGIGVVVYRRRAKSLSQSMTATMDAQEVDALRAQMV